MGRRYYHFLVFCSLCIFCTAAIVDQSFAVGSESDARDDALKKAASTSWRERRLAQGKNIYQQACASCHDEGINGAPAIGDREEWIGRSPLWLGVLLEHAKAGYLGMPPKGSNPELTDQDVDAAGEYMLSITFPEKTLD